MLSKQSRRVSLWAVPLALGLVVMLVLIAAWAGAAPSQSAARDLTAAFASASHSLPSGSATPDPTPCEGNYTYTVSSGVIVPGTNLVPGSQCGGCTTGITLPFAFTFYGQTYTTTNLSSQGNVQFNTTYLPTPVSTVCPFPDPRLGPSILPYWDMTLGEGWHSSCEEYMGSPCGVYTSVTGLAPNRIFNIEWRTQVQGTSQHTAQFEARLHEGTNTIDYIYAWTSYAGWHAAIGLQDGSTRSITYACYVQSGSTYAGLLITWTPPACGPPTPTPTNTPVPGCTLAWNVVSSPTSYEGGTYLYSVSAVSPTDIWAVGSSHYPDSIAAYILHWNGTQWSAVSAPYPTYGFYPLLLGVSALSTNDVWAVGYSVDLDNVNRFYSVTLHWNGSAWSVIPSPNPGGTGATYLAAVKAVSANDVWAVGYFSDQSAGGVRALFLHWNGNSWSLVQGADPAGAGKRLYGIGAVADNDIWAGGAYGSRSVMFHWDGSAWNDMPVPDIGQIYSIGVVTASDIWAVGEGGALHWNGSAWSLAPSPVVPLYGVYALSSADVWAVGPGRQFAHWDGAAWRPTPNSPVSVLYAVTAVSPTELWAVGYYIRPGYTFQTLTEHASGVCNTPTVTPTGLATDTPTRTPTAIPSTTPTPCAIHFTDVQPSDYFYEGVRYLYCHGAISGYGDGTFRPYNYVTRGQVCKIVVLAENFPIYTPPTPTFDDVPVTHPFYQYVETAYHEGIVSGYYGVHLFRPDNLLMRGQLAKVIVLAQQWPIYTPPLPTFNDVPAGSTFYAYIETAYQHNIISGYNCGNPGEPCPGLYFRPGGNATRGQIAKIVYNAIVGP